MADASMVWCGVNRGQGPKDDWVRARSWGGGATGVGAGIAPDVPGEFGQILPGRDG
jgi:hypothetical protein